MKVTKSGKAVLWSAVSLLVMAAAVWMISPLRVTENIVSSYLGSCVRLFCVACCLLGTGVYSFIGYTRRHKEHRTDTWFLLLVGLVLLVLSVVIILRFGGIAEENFDGTANAAINLNIGLCSVLPFPFMVRTWVLAASSRLTTAQRTLAVIAALAAAAVYLVLVCNGSLFGTVEHVVETVTDSKLT